MENDFFLPERCLPPLAKNLRLLVADLRHLPSDFATTLSDSQRDEVVSIALDKRKRERAAEYLLLNRLTGAFPMLDHLPDGSPSIHDPISEPWNISLSHSLNYVALFASLRDEKIGVDIEEHTDKIVKVASRFASAEELSVFTTPALLLRLWTIKEAAYKAAGIEGLSFRESIRVVSHSDFRAEVEIIPSSDTKPAFFSSLLPPTPILKLTARTFLLPDNTPLTIAQSL